MKKFTFIYLFTFTFSLNDALVIMATGASLIFTSRCSAQYAVIYDFNDFKGGNPHGDLTPSHGLLYGMGQTGGTYGYGTIFSVDTNGAGYRDLYNFDGTLGGWGIIGSLTISGSTMYGMASEGGGGIGVYCTMGCGCVFRVDTDGNNYKQILTFNGNNGGFAWGNLTLWGSKLFALSISGGVNNAGCAFTVDTNGNNYKDILDFNQTNGAAPEGSFIRLGNTLYGVAAAGGTHTDGCIFELDSNGTGYRDMHDFDGTDGNGPIGALLYSAGKFYGMTVVGGAHDSGVIFSIDTNGSNFKKLYDFSQAEGAYPRGTLSISGNTLYGLADLGGATDSGVIFKIDTNGSGYSKLVDFTGEKGTNPFGSPTFVGTIMYGMTSYGGPPLVNGGVIFKFGKTITGENQLQVESEKVKVYPNPSKGLFTVSLSHAELVSASQPIVEIYNVMGQKVTVETLKQVQGDNLIDLSTEPNGIYFYRVIANNGNILGEGKLVIQK